MSYVDSPVIEFFDTRKLSSAYEVRGLLPIIITYNIILLYRASMGMLRALIRSIGDRTKINSFPLIQITLPFDGITAK